MLGVLLLLATLFFLRLLLIIVVGFNPKHCRCKIRDTKHARNECFPYSILRNVWNAHRNIDDNRDSMRLRNIHRTATNSKPKDSIVYRAFSFVMGVILIYKSDMV